jgi:hypothetical protein
MRRKYFAAVAGALALCASVPRPALALRTVEARERRAE